VPNFFNDVIEKSPYLHSRTRVAYPHMLAPFVLARVQVIMDEAAKSGNPVMLFETFRSKERQQLLFDQANGVTQLSEVGVHYYGLAADLVRVDENGQPTWQGDYSFLGALARKHGMVWGGPGPRNLNIGDLDHVQMIRFEDQARLFRGEWYPDENYDAFATGEE
jgi:hypothetical protein